MFGDNRLGAKFLGIVNRLTPGKNKNVSKGPFTGSSGSITGTTTVTGSESGDSNDCKMNRLVRMMIETGMKLHELDNLLYQESLLTGKRTDTLKFQALLKNYTREIEVADSLRNASDGEGNSFPGKKEVYHRYADNLLSSDSNWRNHSTWVYQYLDEYNNEGGGGDCGEVIEVGSGPILDEKANITVTTNYTIMPPLGEPAITVFSQTVNEDEVDCEPSGGTQTTENHKEEDGNISGDEEELPPPPPEILEENPEQNCGDKKLAIKDVVDSDSARRTTCNAFNSSDVDPKFLTCIEEDDDDVESMGDTDDEQEQTHQDTNVSKRLAAKNYQMRVKRRTPLDERFRPGVLASPIATSTPRIELQESSSSLNIPCDRSLLNRSLSGVRSGCGEPEGTPPWKNRLKSANESWYEFVERCSNTSVHDRSLNVSRRSTRTPDNTPRSPFSIADYVTRYTEQSSGIRSSPKKSVRFSISPRSPRGRGRRGPEISSEESSDEDEEKLRFEVQDFPCVDTRRRR